MRLTYVKWDCVCKTPGIPCPLPPTFLSKIVTKVIFLHKESSSPAHQALPDIPLRFQLTKAGWPLSWPWATPLQRQNWLTEKINWVRVCLKGSFINQIPANSQRKIPSLSTPFPKLCEIRYIFQSQVFPVLYCLKKQEAGREGAWGGCREGRSVTYCSAKKVEEGQRCVVLRSTGLADASLPQKLIYHLDGFSSFAAKLLSPLK